MQHSDYLVFIFLYILVMFLTAFTGRILYKRSFEKPAGIRMQKLIYLICGLGMLALLLYWIFSHIPGVRGQIEAYATPFLGSQLFISHSTFLLLSALILYEFRLFRPGEFKFFLFT